MSETEKERWIEKQSTAAAAKATQTTDGIRRRSRYG